MQTITQVFGSGVPLLLDDIDTDRIIPARFLRCVTFDGLGDHAFEDDRLQDKSHPFDDARFKSGSILVAGRNFGCGSSREHAPQALMRWGIRAIIAESFAEIFFGNCTTLGIPCVSASRADLDRLAAAVTTNPVQQITVDLIAKQVRSGDIVANVTILESARQSLSTGNWDFLGQLLEGSTEVKNTANHLPYMTGFKA
ncbi:3-isopropylmalate dehydratase small subunit [Schlesneria paludicola]|uniref:3-isopropylmalate dehydratase small subunit n=1 Tax=Schlesneria paludicola TaxID=360056 RepID=UPI00029AA78B|nr:3-isopropylmalate dehydratase small subunit [Schlesneria paludicola]